MANISIIAAVAKNGVIGKNNVMAWHLPEESALFAANTAGKPVIIGRRTFEGLPNALLGRHLIVLTHNESFTTGSSSIQVAHSIPEALKLAGQFKQEIMVAGGESIYQQFLPLSSKMYLSLLHNEYEGDAFFPGVRYSQWQKVQTTRYTDFSFITFEKIHAKQNA